MDSATIAFLAPFVITSLILLVMTYARFVTRTLEPGKITLFIDAAAGLFTAMAWLSIIGIPLLIIGLAIIIAVIDGIFGTDLLRIFT